MRAVAEVAHDVEQLRSAGCVRCRSGLDAADLRAVHTHNEFRVALIGVLGHIQYQLIGTRTKGD